MRCRSGWLVVLALTLASLAIPACRPCNCPSNGGQTVVPFPPAHLSPIVSLSADSPCSLTVAGEGQIGVRTDRVATCDVHVQLESGDKYTFTVVFQSVDQGCCAGVVGTARDLVAQLQDAGTGAQGLPAVPAGCAATCGTAAGPQQTFADAASAAAALAGRWRICGSWPGGLPDDVVGVELDLASVSQPGPDGGTSLEAGDGYALVSGPSGPVPKVALGYLLTWQVSTEDTPGSPQIYLNISTGPGKGVAGVAAYSACPMRINVGVVLVPFGN
jgi:hypothetical protein